MAVVPILRAGLGMVDGVVNIIPAAKICLLYTSQRFFAYQWRMGGI